MRTILIAGGTGLVGKSLVQQLLQKEYEVIILTRKLTDTPHQKNLSYALWNVKEGTIDADAFKKANAIIHLAGAGVMDKKWDETYKKEIEESRTKSSALLIDTLQKIDHKVEVMISASAIGWYGEDKIPNHYFKENENADNAFLGMVCKKWEESVEVAEQIGIRVCKLRIGIVLSNDGGAYKEFRSPLKFGVASILGNGKQIVSWIHIDDLCRQFIFALENENISGSYNAVAPMPVSNKTLTLEIAKNVKGKFYIPIHVPDFILKIMLGGRSVEILKSSTVSCEKIKAAGFTFLYPSIEVAVEQIEKKNILQ
jgi:uncharacterized protein